MKTKEWITIVIVVIIVAVLASLITSSITGDVIKVSEVKKGTQVYTKAEVDGKLEDIVTKQEMLNTLNGCELYGLSATKIPDIDNDGRLTANDICKKSNLTCITAVSYSLDQNGNIPMFSPDTIANCGQFNYPSNRGVTALCC